MRIVLTGAAGFVGSHLAQRLLERGHDVLGVDNLSTGRRENLQILHSYARFDFLEHDVTFPFPVEGPVDWILHLASPASPPRYLNHPLETLRVNAEGTYHLLQMARDKNASFLLASTSEVYGDPLIHPQPEEYWGNVNPIGVRSVYDEAKRYAEALTMAYHRTFGVDIRICRIFNTYGPRMDPYDGRVVSTFIRQALSGEDLTIHGDGSQTRSFQYVDDLVDGILRLMEVSYPKPVNLGNPEEYTILELAQKVLEITGSTSNLRFVEAMEDDPRRRRPDISLAQRILQWSPRVPLREGLYRTVEYFQKVLVGS